jgi:DNA-binding GntR family transcriptional regulator
VSGTARYQQIASTLRGRIADGEFRVGHLLPTEAELCGQFGASRFTVREALRQLDEAGLVARRQGSGTRVISRVPRLRHTVAVGNEADVLRYVGETVLVPVVGPEPGSPWTPAAPELRRELELDERAWLAARAVRRLEHGGPVIGDVTICVLADLAPLLAAIDLAEPRALFARLVDVGGLRLERIEQEIFAGGLPDAAARRLDATPGSPALGVVRRFVADHIGCFEVARTLHPADRFRYRLDLLDSSTAPASAPHPPAVPAPHPSALRAPAAAPAPAAPAAPAAPVAPVVVP